MKICKKNVNFDYVLKWTGEREGRPKTICGSFEAMTVTNTHKFAVVARFDSRTARRFCNNCETFFFVPVVKNFSPKYVKFFSPDLL